MHWVERGGLRWLEAELPGAKVAFTSRHGGLSHGPYESLNLGFHTGDAPEAVAENRRRLAARVGLPVENILSARQVHGAELQIHDAPQSPAPFASRPLPPGGLSRPAPGGPAQDVTTVGEADGQVTTAAGTAPLVLVADCLPVALIGPGPDGSKPHLALLHCGWRPLAAGIIAAGVTATGATHAVIGPGIGPCCFEVGDEVRDVFSHLGPGLNRGRLLDLPEVATRLLRQAGVHEVQRSRHCTFCDAENFFSHRRDGGVPGRQAGLAWLTGSNASRS